MDKIRHINVHLVTDSTGEATLHIFKAIMSQFPYVHAEKFLYPFTASIADVDVLLADIKRRKGDSVIIYTILPNHLINYLQIAIKNMPQVHIVPALYHAITRFGKALHTEVKGLSGRHDCDVNEHDRRIDTITYTMEHDDGMSWKNLNDADIILVGVSRTAKTPISIYLSYRGLKVANIPYVKESHMPPLAQLTKPLIVGLFMDSKSLLSIRSSRHLSNYDRHVLQNTYANPENIAEELRESRLYCARMNFHTVDVSGKSIEEIATMIIKLYLQKGGRLGF